MTWNYNGVCITENEFYDGPYPDVNFQLDILAANNVNFISVLIPFASYENKKQNTERWWNSLEALFEAAENRGMTVLFRPMGTWYTGTGIFSHDIERYFTSSGVLTWLSWIEWFKTYATRWNGRFSNVVFELLSEPLNVPNDKYTQKNLECYDAIRDIDGTRKIGISANGTDQGYGGNWHYSFSFAKALDLDNVMFTFDGYGSIENASEEYYKTYRIPDDTAILLNSGYEVVAAEFGVDGTSGYTQGWRNSLINFFNYAKNNISGAAYWRWSMNESSGLKLINNWNGDLTQVCKDLFSIYQGYILPEPEPEPEPTPKPTYAARTIGPLGVPTALLHKMWLAREKVIRPEVHKKLHPLV